MLWSSPTSLGNRWNLFCLFIFHEARRCTAQNERIIYMAKYTVGSLFVSVSTRSLKFRRWVEPVQTSLVPSWQYLPDRCCPRLFVLIQRIFCFPLRLPPQLVGGLNLRLSVDLFASQHSPVDQRLLAGALATLPL
ncbi:hypothetical protein EV702DRAFT_1126298, partial [Suillus placidus]